MVCHDLFMLPFLFNMILTQGRYREADSKYRQALKILRTYVGEEHLQYALFLNNLAESLTDQARPGETLSALILVNIFVA